MRQAMLGLTIGCMAFAGCTSPNAPSSTGETVAEGAGIGAVGGALIGGLFHGWRGAAIGGGIGALLGGGAGGYVASQKSKYASVEQRIAGQRRLSEQATATARAETAASASKLRVADAQLAELQQMQGDRAAAQHSATVMLASLQRQRSDLETSRAQLETGIRNQQDFIAETEREIGPDDPGKTAELARWKADIPQMQSALAAMTDQISDVSAMEGKVQQARSSCC